MEDDLLSIIVPVFNTSKYLERCLNSILKQTYQEIEIICVDDGSTDESPMILEKFAAAYPRVTVVRHEENLGLLEARKTGVEKARGAFIQFLDSDDMIDPELCACAVGLIKKHNADIAELSARQVDIEKNSQMIIDPSCGILEDQAILEGLFVTRKASTSLVLKIYRSELCKKAFEAVPHMRCYAGEDVLASFFLACYASKYIGLPTGPKYTYYLGAGISSGVSITLEKYSQFCQMSSIPEVVRDFLAKEKASPETYTAYEHMTRRLIGDCCLYYSQLPESDLPEALRIFREQWSGNEYFLLAVMSVVRSQKKLLDDVYDSETFKLGSFFVDPIHKIRGYFREMLSEKHSRKI